MNGKERENRDIWKRELATDMKNDARMYRRYPHLIRLMSWQVPKERDC